MLIDYDQQLDAAEKKEALVSIDKGTERLVALIDQLLDMSWLESGRFLLKKEKENITRLVAAAVGEFKVRSPQHTFVLNAPKRLPNLNIDHKRIRQVIDNILDNAVKYSPQNSVITARISRRKGEVLVSVSDQGEGIPESELTKIFDRMYRRKERINFKVKGVGLGLAIARHIVEAHGGRMWAENNDNGKGSTFYFTLPIEGNADAAAPHEAPGSDTLYED